MTLTGCQQQTMDLSAQTDECLIFKPIYWSGKDTKPTIVQIKSHNAAGKAVCGWGNNK